jgi:hypothetical protein
MIKKDRWIFTLYGLVISNSAIAEFSSGHGIIIQVLSIYVLLIGLSFLISSWIIKSLKLAKRIMLFSSWNIILYNIFAFAIVLMNTIKFTNVSIVLFIVLTVLLIVNVSIQKRIKSIVVER